MFMAAFVPLGRLVTPKYMVHSPLDDMIPFSPWMVYIYASWFFYVALMLAYTVLSEGREYFRNMLFLVICYTVSNFIFIAFPNGIAFRPEAPESGIGSLLLQIIYGTDNPTNCFPSLHCSLSMGAFLIFLRSERFPKKLLPLSFIYSAAICYSTCAIKQHSVLDFFGALALVAIAWPLSELISRRRYRTK